MRRILLTVVCLVLFAADASARDRRYPVRNAFRTAVGAPLIGQSYGCPQSCGAAPASVPQAMPGPATTYYVTPANCANGQCPATVVRYAR